MIRLFPKLTYNRYPMIAVLLLFFGVIMSYASEKNSYAPEVLSLVENMTIEEKVGQMTEITLMALSHPREEGADFNTVDIKKLEEAILKYHVGSILNTGGAANTLANWREMIPLMQNMATQKTRLKIPLIYGIDAIHGANYIKEATLFPQSIALAATRNRDLVKQSALITAREIRAAGLPWNYNPVLGVGRQPLWSRMWETFGEDTYLAGEMGLAYIEAMEGNPSGKIDKDHAAACAKHYLGYSLPLSGRDRTPAWIPERMMRELFLPPFEKAVKAGVRTFMVNSSEINGIPVHSSKYLLTDVLKKELGFKGFVVSDWEDIIRLYTRERVADSPKEAVRMAVMAGMDMSMVPHDYSFYIHLVDLVKEGSVPMARIDDAVSRILQVKYESGLFDNPYPIENSTAFSEMEQSRIVSLEAAREAITLLENRERLLPLKKGTKILITGPTANSMAALNGGWSYTWQGNEEKRYPAEKETILEALQRINGPDNVLYAPGAGVDTLLNIDAAKQKAGQAEVIVLALGEEAYCETPGSIVNLNLPDAQITLAREMLATGKPVIIILAEGRPRIISPVADKADAVLLAYLPGNEGGTAIAEIVFGEVNPSGKLPFTYPRHVNYLMTYDHKLSEIVDGNVYDPQWPFGHGISYTEFTYANLKLSSGKMASKDKLTVSVDVKNSGPHDGKETVELYLSDLFRSVTPPVRQLKRFEKPFIKAGEIKTVTFDLSAEDLSFIDRNNKRITEEGEFKVAIDTLSANFVYIKH